jgi:hypothetical protein
MLVVGESDNMVLLESCSASPLCDASNDSEGVIDSAELSDETPRYVRATNKKHIVSGIIRNSDGSMQAFKQGG